MKPTQLTKRSLAEAAAHLARQDPDLACILETHGPPPLWSRKPGFATLIHIILEQQVSLASAASMFERLKRQTVPLEPGRIVELGEAHLRMLGFTRQKTTYCLHLSHSILNSHLEIEKLPKLDDDSVRAALMQVKGIGAWSADVYLLMVLLRPDIWPASDLALATAAFKVKRLKQRPTPEVLTKLAESWRPFRSVAARMLWQHYLAPKSNPSRAFSLV